MTTQDVIQDIAQKRTKFRAAEQNIDHLKAFHSDYIIALYFTLKLYCPRLSDRRSSCFVSRGCGHV